MLGTPRDEARFGVTNSQATGQGQNIAVPFATPEDGTNPLSPGIRSARLRPCPTEIQKREFNILKDYVTEQNTVPGLRTQRTAFSLSSVRILMVMWKLDQKNFTLSLVQKEIAFAGRELICSDASEESDPFSRTG